MAAPDWGWMQEMPQGEGPAAPQLRVQEWDGGRVWQGSSPLPVIKQQPLMHVEKEGEKENRISKPKPSDYCLPPRGAQKYIVHLIEAYKSLKNIYKIIEGNGNHLFK